MEFRTDLRVERSSDSILERTETRSSGAAVRTGRRGGRSFYGSAVEPDALFDLVRASATGRRFPSPLPDSGPERFPIDTGGGVSNPDRIVSDLVDRTLEHANGATARAALVAFDQVVLGARGDGRIFGDRRRGCRVRLEVSCGRGLRRGNAVGERAARPGRPLDVEGLAAVVASRAVHRGDAGPPPADVTDVVFAPGVGGVLIHEIVGHALEADVVGRRPTLVASHPAAIAPGSISVLDDPRRGRGAWRVDDEGEDARAVALVQGGRVRSLLTDHGSAARAGGLLTGHGRRASFRDQVLPRMGATFVAAGAATPEDSLIGIRRGLLVRRMEAAGSDPWSGIAIFRVSDADLIEGGRITRPIFPHVIQVSALSALATMSEPADDLEFDTCIGSCVRDGQPLVTSVGAPTFRIGVVRVRC